MDGLLYFENKNIIILLKSFELGGAEKQGLYLANYLQNKKGCNVYIYSYIKSPNSKLFYQECEKYQLRNLYIEKNPLSASGQFKYLKRRIKIALFGLKLRKHRPDIIIPYLNPPSIIAALSYKLAGAKITFWHHRGPDYYRYDKLEKIAIKKAPLCIANSPDGKEELLAVLKDSINKTYFLPNFSTVEAINQNKEIKKLNDLKGEIIIGMIGHFRTEKRQYQLVKAFYKVLDKYNNCHLVLLGNVHDSKDEVSDIKKVSSFIAAKKLENNVTIIHNCSAEALLPYLDIGVLLSKKEGMPNVIMEYMAYKLPIICTKHAGCVSLLGNDYPFYINDNNDIDTIASKLETLLKDKPLRQKIGAENKNRLQKDFLIDTYLDKLATLINTY